MYLQNLRLYHFRNYEDRFFTFSEGLNCIVGKNGSGKTNLLDAVYFLALSKSAIHNQDQLSIRFGEDFCVGEGAFRSDREEVIAFHLPRQGKKTVSADRKVYERLSDHIGKYPVVLIAPNDTDLVRDGAETRRKLFDGILSQLYPDYLQTYLVYNKALDQRNSLLKQFAEQQFFDADLLRIYSAQVVHAGKVIFESRKHFVEKFTPFFNTHYAALSENREAVSLNYLSDNSSPDFEQRFYAQTERDLAAQRTTMGVHKDDYEFLMDGMAVKKFGSQGQRKSYVMALKLAQFDWIYREKGIKPILLLDDIFDKLDDRRIESLIAMIRDGAFGQVFITDARPERTAEILADVEVNLIRL